MEHGAQILSGKVSRDHIYVFICCYPRHSMSKLVQLLKGTSSKVFLQEFPHFWNQLWGRHVWARGYLAANSGTITDEMVEQHISEQEGEPLQVESQFVIDETTMLRPSRR
jgi:putative transposase